MLVAQQNQQNMQAEHKKDELISLANNISNNLNCMVHQQQIQSQNPPTVNVIPTTSVLPPSMPSIIPGQVISTAPVIASNAPLITSNSLHLIADQQQLQQQQTAPLITSSNILPINPNLNPNLNQILNQNQFTQLNQPNFPNLPNIPNQTIITQLQPQPTATLTFQQQPFIHNIHTLPNTFGKELPVIPYLSNTIIQPSHFDSLAPTNLVRTIRPLRSTLSLGANNALSRKDRRRLPLPTYEEIQQATVALGLNNRLSGLSCEKVVCTSIFEKYLLLNI